MQQKLQQSMQQLQILQQQQQQPQQQQQAPQNQQMSQQTQQTQQTQQSIHIQQQQAYLPPQLNVYEHSPQYGPENPIYMQPQSGTLQLKGVSQQQQALQQSDTGLTRIGLNRRLSTHMQRLPSLSSINGHSGSSSASISPVGSSFPADQVSQVSQNLQQVPQQQSSLKGDKSPLFKNYWGFGNENQLSPSSTTTPNLEPLNYHQNKMHSIGGIPQLSPINQFSNNTNALNASNLAMSSFNSNQDQQQQQQNSLYQQPIYPGRSNSFAVSKSKFNQSLPTTYESNNDPNNKNRLQQFQFNLLQQQQQRQKQHLIQKQQQQQQQQSYLRRLSQEYEPHSLNTLPNAKSKYILESQQQQVIPPLRAEGPVSSYLETENKGFNQLRRESVPAMYHHLSSSAIAPVQPQEKSLSPGGKGPVASLVTDENYQHAQRDTELNSTGDLMDEFTDFPLNEKPQSLLQLQPLFIPKEPKFTKFHPNDLNHHVNPSPKYRRISSSQTFVSPLKALTTDLSLSYSLCVPEYDYQKSKNPRRVLTKNSKPFHNGGCDNEQYDYILYVNDILGTEENKKYLVLDILGQGTFGQVVKCQNLKTQEIVAVKVVKARQECLQQSITEGNILEYLNKNVNPSYEKYFIKLKDKFMHKFHLCLVFELLSSNLYELIKQNHHHGLNMKLVRSFAVQILDGLCALKELKIIHCDLKPENILLKTLNKPDLKIIDFGSACQDRQTLYSYVQSRFYRSPEVILGVEYSTPVDMWSFGCIVAELFLGLPLLPGTSEYEQLVRIVQTFGMPPMWMMVEKKSSNYIVKNYDKDNKVTYKMKTLEEFNRDFNLNEQPEKQYFSDTKLDKIIMNYRLPKKNMTQKEIDVELRDRSCLIHFLTGVLNINPLERWSPNEAILHPFITGEIWTGEWSPPMNQYGTYSNSNLTFNNRRSKSIV